MSLEELGRIEVISVSKRPELLSQAAAAIYVINSEDIRRSGALTLPEVLRLAPNLEVARINAFSYAITARGFNSPESGNKLLVLIDGRSVYSPLGSTVFWEALNLPLEDVERIEVVSGPGGTLYGANAVNGVINIITRSSKETQGGLAVLSAGTEDRQGLLRYGGKIGESVTYRVYGMGFQRDETLPVMSGDRSDDGFWGQQGGVRVDGVRGTDSFTVQGDFYRNKIDSTYDYLLSGGNALARWIHGFENGSSLQLQTYYSKDDRVQPGLVDRLDTYDVEAQHTIVLGAHAIVWGAGFRLWQEGIFSQGPFVVQTPNKALTVGNLFAQDGISLTPAVKLTLGLKAEDNSYSGLNLLPDLRLGWQATPSVFLWSAVSRAVRTPSRIDRELEAPGILVPSPYFASEKLTAYEIGYRGTPLPRLSLSVSGFYNVYDNLRTDALSTTGLPIQLANGLAGDTYGVEAWGSYRMLDWWRLKAGANWLHKNLHLKAGNTDLSLQQSAGQDPIYQAQLRSEMSLFPNWELDAAVRRVGHVTRPYVTPYLVPAYVEADLRLGWHVTPGTELSLAGTNLLHDHHLEAYDPSTWAPRYISRTVYLTLRTQF